MNHEDELEKIESESVEALRERLNTLNRCWYDGRILRFAHFQQKIADRLLEHYDALAVRLAEAERLLRGALIEIEATGAAEGYYFGPDPQIDEKIIRFLANEPDSASVDDPEATVHKEVGVSRPAKSVRTPTDDADCVVIGDGYCTTHKQPAPMCLPSMRALDWKEVKPK